MKISLAAVVIALSVVLAAYGGGQSEQAKSGQQYVIRFMMRDTPSTTAGVTQVGDIFQRGHRQVRPGASERQSHE